MSSSLMSLSQRPLRLAVATLVLAVGGALSMSASAQPGGHGPGHHGRGAHAGGHEFGGMPIQRLLRDANVTPEQRTQIRQIMDAARTELRATRESGRSLREQSMALFTQPTVDARAAEALRQQMLAQHDQASKRMLQAMIDVSRVLTPEQRQQMAERMKNRRALMERHRSERNALEKPKT